MLSRSFILMFLALAIGIVSGACSFAAMDQVINFVAQAFIHLLKLISLPIIFLSLVTTATSVGSVRALKGLGQQTLKYTILTTLLASLVALGLYLLTEPRVVKVDAGNINLPISTTNGWLYLLKIIPVNPFQPFLEHNVLGVLFLAIILSLALLQIPQEQREPVRVLFSGLYAVIMKITSWIMALIPLAVWAFVAIFVKDLYKGLALQGLGVYLAILVAANLLQVIVILPLLLRRHGIPVRKLAFAMAPALTTAFFSKSSAAAMPVAINCAEKNFNLPPKVTRFCFPLCTSINMNGCAAFILITVLFVAHSEGVVFTTLDMLAWVLIATLTAFGNAGVPMGCFFIATSLLTTMNVPLTLMGVILPFYTLLDMLETTTNVWSDSCISAIVAQEMKLADE